MNNNEEYKLYNGDCLAVMDKLIEQGVKVDAVICDPPYGTTACKWDIVIPFDEMWNRLNKLIKPTGAIALFATEPFATKLRISNFDNYKYDWYWKKSKSSLYQHAKNRPMRAIENVCVFSKSKWGHKSQLKDKRMEYNPQGISSIGIKTVTKNFNAGGVVGERPNQIGKQYEAFTGFPTDVLEFKSITGKSCLHPTQKPVDLLEYLIRTYTNENDLVLDFTMGSGSTGVACINTNRKFIGVEINEKYFNIAKDRIEAAILTNKQKRLF
jgi:site-specific DNA-methyltransferase (adenine-specific)